MLRDYTGSPDESPRPEGAADPPRLVPCSDCGASIPETIEPGRHAPRRVGSKLVNCVGRVLE